MNDKERKKIQLEYVQRLIDELTTHDLIKIVSAQMMGDYNCWTWVELRAEIEGSFPDLLLERLGES